jgi:carbonic anhydrase
MDANQALERLKQGNERYIADKLQSGAYKLVEKRKSLEVGQSPYAIVLSCADSRVVPEMLFDAGLGELFVVRVAGNIANTDSMASIEFAVASLKTKLIVVLGHQDCGAVTAAIQGGDNGKNLNHLLGQITPAIESSKSREVDDVVRANAKYVAGQLVKNSEIIADAVEKDGLVIVSAYYSLGPGKVEYF